MKELLLDTHTFLWWEAGDPRLGPETKTLIHNADSVFVSAVSALEVAIKIAAKRMRSDFGFARTVDLNGFLPLPVNFGHAKVVERMPIHHKDPFDRLLIAQAIAEDLTFVTADQIIFQYSAKIFDAER